MIHFAEELIAVPYVVSVRCALVKLHVSDRGRVIGIVQPVTLDAIRVGHKISQIRLP